MYTPIPSTSKLAPADAKETSRASNNKWKIAVGVIALLGLGIVAVSLSPRAQQRLETTNNIIRRYRCPPGGYPAGRNANGDCLCLKCPAGFHCPGGYSGKVPCPRGTFQNLLGQNTCKKSPPGYHSPRSGQPLPTQCPIGFYQPGKGHWACIPSFPGHFVPQPRMINQVKCPVGKYQNQRGQSACKPAPRGTYVNLVGQSRPTPCNYGSYNDRIGKVRCRPARPGRYVSSRGQVTDVLCGKNTYQHCYGQVRCIPCARGLFAGRGARRCAVRQIQPVRVNSKPGQHSAHAPSGGHLKAKKAKTVNVDEVEGVDIAKEQSETELAALRELKPKM